MTDMGTLVLAGQSARNEEWLNTMVDTLNSQTSLKAVPWRYSHWREKGSDISPNLEVQNFSTSFVEKTDVSFAIAKSAGVVILKKLLDEQLISPRAICIMGVPVSWAQSIDEMLLPWIVSLKIPVLVMQNVEDPACSAANLHEAIAENKMVTSVALNGEAHEYNDALGLVHRIETFLNGVQL